MNLLNYLPTVIPFVSEAFAENELNKIDKTTTTAPTNVNGNAVNVNNVVNVAFACIDGESRPAAFITAYVMYSKRMSYNNASALIRINRNEARPNFGFTRQLREFEKNLHL